MDDMSPIISGHSNKTHWTPTQIFTEYQPYHTHNKTVYRICISNNITTKTKSSKLL